MTDLRVQVKIRNIAVGGDGVGEVISQSDGESDLMGISAFVPYTGIGEEVSAKIVERKKNYVRGELLSVTSESTWREDPPCEYYGQCGGCELQHLSYEGQVEAKMKMLQGALRSARVPSDVFNVLKPLVLSEPLHYRRRISLHIDGRGSVGFYRPKTRSVVPITRCEIATDKINACLQGIQEFSREVGGVIGSIGLEQDEHGVIAVLRARYDLGTAEQQHVLKAAKAHFESVTLLVNENEIGGYGGRILELPLVEGGTFSLRIPAGGFSQINWYINRQLVKRVVETFGPYLKNEVHDLYAGAGNFALPLARAGAHVVAVEAEKHLAAFGKESAERLNSSGRMRYIHSSVEAFLKDKKNQAALHTVVADPPRSGLQKVVESIKSAKRLALISCHVPSFVRDLRALLDDSWQLVSIEPFDMFPQTSYLEILSVYTRDN